ncbi:hypothetical protein EKD16_25275 (plasmid) [Streptomonospora litoralis]|uniref:Minor tail T domain-containing protein n=1 Tax=Streptomonospora litoralis TaxID=2498135 RepID=A0A4P6Q7L9_9ACTN|nr:hypothetical protein [Streptomonospora litoralis]QBI56796.1 hypothetical protein EKD16_25275 [Streptomonospora litoralis]
MDRSRDDILTGIVAERVTTMLTQEKKGKRRKRLTAEDFIPKWGKRAGSDKRQTPEQQKSLLKALTEKFGGKSD